MKNFDELSCIFCGEKAFRSKDQCPACGMKLDVYNEIINNSANGYQIIKYVARGFYGLTYKAKDRFGKKFALKIISKESYKKFNKDFYDEAEKFARLPDIPTISKYIKADETKVIFQKKQCEFYLIISEWIDGVELSKINEDIELVPEDLLMASRDMLSTLHELHELNLWHNDLHDENVMVTEISESQKRLFSRSVPRIYKIIDIGSMVYKNPGSTKAWGDMVNVGSHIFKLAAILKKNFQIFSKEDQLFIELIEEICSQLMDEDISRNFESPMKALDQVEKYFRLSRMGTPRELKTLDDPFGFINANDIPSPWLIKNMFSDRLSYFKDIMSTGQQSLLITGPRGCGKTMILKNMRFLTLYDAQDDKDDTFFSGIPYVGLFISARTNFGNFLVSFRDQPWAKNEEKISLYFNILVTIELISVLYRLKFDNHVSESDVDSILSIISERFKIPYISLNTAKSKLIEISRKIISDQPITADIENSTPAYLNDIISGFKRIIRPLRGKDIFILVDDLSLPRVPKYVQMSIIPSIFNTGADYKTRVTSHSEGIITQDHSGEVYNRNRDFREINLGYEYWELSNDYEVCKNCFDDILSKRYKLAGRDQFPGLEIILGKGEHLNDIGREIHRLASEKKLRTLRYHGAMVFIKLCTGDLSYLLDILGQMDRRAESKSFPINIDIQNQIIKHYARNELLKLQDIRAEHVRSLYDIAYAFGTLSKTKVIKKDHDYLKIEVEIQDLPEDLQTTLRELLCYGIFIDAGSGNNSSGKFCKKLYFRRIYTPAFPTTFITRNTFSWRVNSFKKFVYDPINFMKERMSRDKINTEEQSELGQLQMF